MEPPWHHGKVARLRRSCAACRTHMSRHVVASAFLAWKHLRSCLTFADFCFSPWKRQAQQAHAVYCHELDTASVLLRKACAADRAEFLQACARQASAGQDRAAFQAVRRLLGHKRRKAFAPEVLPCLLKEDGAQCDSPSEVADRWRQHFGALEAGVSASPAQILEACGFSNSADWPTPPSLLTLPDEGLLARIIASAALHKSPGPDGLPAALGRAAPNLLASQLFPLLLKFCIRGQEAAGLKGGLLAHIYKGHGPHNKCSSHRGILMVATFAKYLHQALRPSIRDHFQVHSLPLQLGGRPGTPVTCAAHLVRSFLRWQSLQGASCCVLFSDISAAFYAAVRQLAAPVPLSDFQQLCAGLALSQGDLDGLREHVNGPSALAQDGASEWLQRVAAEIHSNTWMHIGGTIAEPLLTNRGTRPGSAWADLMLLSSSSV